MAYTNFYLVNMDKMTKMHLPHGLWDKIFPDPIDEKEKHIPIRLRQLKTFKFRDVFPQRKLDNKYYLRYLMEQTGVMGEEKNFGMCMEKVCKWCLNYDIICVPWFEELEDLVLTGTLDVHEKTGKFYHYIRKIKIKWIKLMSRWRIYKLTHWKRQYKSTRSSEWATRGIVSDHIIMGEENNGT